MESFSIGESNPILALPYIVVYKYITNVPIFFHIIKTLKQNNSTFNSHRFQIKIFYFTQKKKWNLPN
jgi:hypothetical protein